MSSTTTIPVQIAPDAAARVVELGREQEFETMLEHTRRTVANLRSIEVVLYHDPEEPGQPRVVITAWLNGPVEEEAAVRDAWGGWQLTTFPPAVFRWFSFDAYSWDHYGR